MKRIAVWSGFAGVLLSHMIAVGCSSSDSKSGGSGSGGDSSDGGSAPMGGSNPGTGSTSSGGADSSGGTGGETMGGFGGAMGGSAGAGPMNYLENPGFEEGSTDKLAEIPGWEESDDIIASYLEGGSARSGAQKLGHWMLWETDGDWYEVSTYQTVTSIPNGTYTFSIWVMRDQWFDEQYLFARDYDGDAEMTQSTEDDFSDSAYVKVELSGIEVTNNQVTVGIYSAAPAGVWANFDDAALIEE